MLPCWLTDFVIIHLSLLLIWRHRVSIHIFASLLLSINHSSLFFISRSFQGNDDPCSFWKAKTRPALWRDERGAHNVPHTILCLYLSITIIITFGVCLCVTQGEKIIFEYFSDPEFIDQLIGFLSLEDRKGNDSFNPRRFCLFKVPFKLSASIDLACLLQRSDTAYHR